MNIKFKKFLALMISVITVISIFSFSTSAATTHTHNLKTERSTDNTVEYQYCNSTPSSKSVYYATDNFPDSVHDYSNNQNTVQTFTCPGATALDVTFSEETFTEKNYDIITIYNGSNKVVGSYSGDELAGKTINVKGSKFSIRLRTDRSKTFYGYKVTSVVAWSGDLYYALHDNSYPETPHEYSNNYSKDYYYTYPGATDLTVKFSPECEFEWVRNADADYVEIYDANDKFIGKYQGKELANKTIKFSTPGFKISFRSDRSKTFYGFKIDSVQGTVRGSTEYMKPTPAQTVIAPVDTYPESSHDYGNYLVERKTFSYPYATALKVDFSNRCKTEADYDIINIYDGNGSKIGQYSGTQLAGKTLNIPTGSFEIEFITDRSKNFYGYSIDRIEATINMGHKRARSTNGDDLTTLTPIMPATSHNYQNNANETFYYTDALADSLDIMFDYRSKTEKNWDFICVYDKNGKQIAKLSGDQASCKSVHIPGNSFSITFTSDRSKNFYGYSMYYISANYSLKNQSFNALMADNKCAYPESTHDYENYADSSKQYYYYEAPTSRVKQLDIRFSRKSNTEWKCDIITIFDGSGKTIGKYSGWELAGKTVSVPGNKFTILLTSDRSKSSYGFSIEGIYAVHDTDYYSAKELSHSMIPLISTASTLEYEGEKVEYCKNCGKITKTKISKLIDGSFTDIDYINDFVYTANVVDLKLNIQHLNAELKQGVDYDVVYNTDRKSVGTHTATIEYKGNYVGSQNVKYTIRPQNVSNQTVKANYQSIDVSWNYPTGTTGCEVECATNPDFKNAIKITEANGKKTLKLKKLKNWTQYYVRLRSLSKDNTDKTNSEYIYSDYSQTYIVRTYANAENTTPNVTLTSNSIKYSNTNTGGRQIAVLWDTIDGIDKYEIQLSYSPDFSTIVKKAETTSNQYTFTNVNKADKYYVRVRTYTKGYNYSSWNSTYYDFITNRTPAKPANIKATVNRNSINLTWNKSANAESYEIKYYPVNGSNVKTVTTTNNSYSFSNLEYETTYKFEIKAVNSDFSSAAVTASATTRPEQDLDQIIADANKNVTVKEIYQKDGKYEYVFDKPVIVTEYLIDMYIKSNQSATYKNYTEMLKKAYKEIGIKSSMDDITKLVRIDEWLYLNLVYTKTNTNIEDDLSIGALKHGNTACMGYAALFNDFCYLAGIPAYYCASDTSNNAWAHAYNMVQIDGYWYIADPTEGGAIAFNGNNPPGTATFESQLNANTPMSLMNIYPINYGYYYNHLIDGYKIVVQKQCIPFGTDEVFDTEETRQKIRNAITYCHATVINARNQEHIERLSYKSYTNKQPYAMNVVDSYF